ncbi:MAG: hypothetical protein EOP37_06830 [Rubrivivax sp.]|nr:MAG: hypothetical protein EOP37_06830 [Rubrivivax sp.]
MRTLIPTPVDDELALQLLASNSSLCDPHVSDIYECYEKYKAKSGDPRVLAPLGLAEPICTELEGWYRAARKRDGLQWITTYRAAKGLSHCPLCGNAGPTSLEHYLPRSSFAEFTVFSWNLIPSCVTCNSKRGRHANGPGTVVPLIHPYFDGPAYNEALLTANIEPPYISVTFTPAALGHLKGDVLQRVTKQISTCINEERFNETLSAKWTLWRGKAVHCASVDSLRQDIERELQSTIGPMGKNSWDAAFLRAVLEDVKALTWMQQNPVPASGMRPFGTSSA